MNERQLHRALTRLAHARADFRPYLIPMLRLADTSMTGKTMENGQIRWHTYRSGVRVWDLADAGKRGKKVQGFALYDIDYISDDEIQTKADQFAFRLRTLDFSKAKQFAAALVKEAQGKGEYSPKIHDFEEKAVDVAPAGFKPFEKATPEFEITSTWTEYSVRDRSDRYNLPACYNTGKRDVKRFFRWITDNWGRIKNLTYRELTDKMSQEGFKFRSYCRMD